MLLVDGDGNMALIDLVGHGRNTHEWMKYITRTA